MTFLSSRNEVPRRWDVQGGEAGGGRGPLPVSLVAGGTRIHALVSDHKDITDRQSIKLDGYFSRTSVGCKSEKWKLTTRCGRLSSGRRRDRPPKGSSLWRTPHLYNVARPRDEPYTIYFTERLDTFIHSLYFPCWILAFGPLSRSFW